MKRVLLCLLLAGCASHYADNSPQAYCERQANNDPAVQELISQEMGSGGTNIYTDAKIKELKRQALQRCLLAKGVPVRGGVEPVMRQ